MRRRRWRRQWRRSPPRRAGHRGRFDRRLRAERPAGGAKRRESRRPFRLRARGRGGARQRLSPPSHRLARSEAASEGAGREYAPGRAREPSPEARRPELDPVRSSPAETASPRARNRRRAARRAPESGAPRTRFGPLSSRGCSHSERRLRAVGPSRRRPRRAPRSRRGSTQPHERLADHGKRFGRLSAPGQELGRRDQGLGFVEVRAETLCGLADTAVDISHAPEQRREALVQFLVLGVDGHQVVDLALLFGEGASLGVARFPEPRPGDVSGLEAEPPKLLSRRRVEGRELGASLERLPGLDGIGQTPPQQKEGVGIVRARGGRPLSRRRRRRLFRPRSSKNRPRSR